MQLSLNWKKDLTFTSTVPDGHSLVVSNDADESGQRPGFAPLELMALSVAGCTGMDVISILQKKRQQVSALELRIHTERAERHPRVWTRVKIEYLITGKDIDPQAVERSIQLSAEKYCSAQNMINKAVPIEHSYQIIAA